MIKCAVVCFTYLLLSIFKAEMRMSDEEYDIVTILAIFLLLHILLFG